MGNMLPCLVQQGTASLPAAMNDPKRRHISLKLLMKAISKMKRRHGGSNAKSKIIADSKSSSSSAAAVAEEDGKGGRAAEAIIKSKANNPKGAVLRSRLHHGRGGGGGCSLKNKKGVVRVKVVLTKEEAARLLSLSVGGQKSAAQIVAEIKRMEARRAANAAASAWRPALESIPEESW